MAPNAEPRLGISSTLAEGSWSLTASPPKIWAQWVQLTSLRYDRPYSTQMPRLDRRIYCPFRKFKSGRLRGTNSLSRFPKIPIDVYYLGGLGPHCVARM